MTDLEKVLIKKIIPIRESLPLDIDSTSKAAVLILFVNLDGNWNIVFTRRTKEVSSHQGEVSFPGGSYEKEDKSLAHTALRETWEEIGVVPDCITLLGALNPHKTIYNLHVYPFIGVLKCAADFNENSDEVDRVFLIPIDWLSDMKNIYKKDHVLNGRCVKSVLHYNAYQGEHLWGLTARITREILSQLK